MGHSSVVSMSVKAHKRTNLLDTRTEKRVEKSARGPNWSSRSREAAVGTYPRADYKTDASRSRHSLSLVRDDTAVRTAQPAERSSRRRTAPAPHRLDAAGSSRLSASEARVSGPTTRLELRTRAEREAHRRTARWHCPELHRPLGRALAEPRRVDDASVDTRREHGRSAHAHGERGGARRCGDVQGDVAMSVRCGVTGNRRSRPGDVDSRHRTRTHRARPPNTRDVHEDSGIACAESITYVVHGFFAAAAGVTNQAPDDESASSV